MDNDTALDALKETRDQLNANIPTELLRALLEVERRHAFDKRDDQALRELEGLIDTYLKEAAPS